LYKGHNLLAHPTSHHHKQYSSFALSIKEHLFIAIALNLSTIPKHKPATMLFKQSVVLAAALAALSSAAPTGNGAVMNSNSPGPDM
jgi:energy-converting hydrogenase Eha subunit A